MQLSNSPKRNLHCQNEVSDRKVGGLFDKELDLDGGRMQVRKVVLPAHPQDSG